MKIAQNKFNIIDYLILQHANKSKVALISDSKSITYPVLLSSIINFSSKVEQITKLKKESIVALLFDDSLESSICFLSLIYHVVPCYLNPQLPIISYDFYLKSISTQLILISSKYIDKFRDCFILNNLKYAVISDDIIEHESVNVMNKYNSYFTHYNSPLFCSYTSGTTGHPSAVIHQHKDVEIMNKHYVKQVLNVKNTDVIFSTSKMYFAYGLNNLFISLFNGAISILSCSDLGLNTIWNIFRRCCINHFENRPSL